MFTGRSSDVGKKDNGEQMKFKHLLWARILLS